jgi:hypothetical protein
MTQDRWKFAGLILLAVLVTASIAAFAYTFRVRREANGTYADAQRSLRETKYQDEAIVLFRADRQNGSVQFTPSACLRLPKGVSDFAWKNVSVEGLHIGPHCQGAIAIVGPDERPIQIAYIYDGIVGLPTDLADSVTLRDYLAAIDAEAK